jgi:hypothetical protein
MGPWEVFGIQDSIIGPATWVAALQLVPPLVEEMNPTDSWQVAAVQVETGGRHPPGDHGGPGGHRAPDRSRRHMGGGDPAAGRDAVHDTMDGRPSGPGTRLGDRHRPALGDPHAVCEITHRFASSGTGTYFSRYMVITYATGVVLAPEVEAYRQNPTAHTVYVRTVKATLEG